MDEHFFQCQNCGENISMLFDYSIANQIYIEDCEICCNPIEIEVEFKDKKLFKLTTRNV